MSGWKSGDPLVHGRDALMNKPPETFPTGEWIEKWRLTDHNTPVRHGVEELYIEADGSRKIYRAFALLPSDMHADRLVSDEYEALDSADPNFEECTRPGDRDIVIQRAAVARAMMLPNQKSPRDMRNIADNLRKQALRLYTQWQADQDRIARTAVEDEDAFKSARTLIRGLQLLRDSGTDEEKTVAKQLLGKGK